MDQQPNPLLHFTRPNETEVHECPSSSRQKYVSHKGKDLGCTRMLKCFPAKSLKRIRHQIGSMETGVIMQKADSGRQNSKAFRLYGASQHPQAPRNEPRVSALLCVPPFLMLDEHTLHYAHLQSDEETTV